MSQDPCIGVLALQGAFREHCHALNRLGVESREIRLPRDLLGIRGLIVPGGESTAIGKLLVEWALLEPIREMGLRGMPIWGTCAGAILLAKRIEERGATMDQPRFGLMSILALRNAFGRQRESFEAELSIKGLDAPFRAVFIRAPVLVPDSPHVEVLSRIDDQHVFLRENHYFASSFHPELTEDSRIHRLFLDQVEKADFS